MLSADMIANGQQRIPGNLQSLNLKSSYRSPNDSPLESFYLPCLNNSSVFKRSVGYFRSSIYVFAGTDTIEFARNGGKIQIICSPELSQDDIKTIAESYDRREDVAGAAFQRDFEALISKSETNIPARVLSTLILTDSLDIRIAVRTDGSGLYHEKLGFFEDRSGNQVSFVGSANETFSGWSPSGNVESIEVFTNWGPESDRKRVQTHQEIIEGVWDSRDPHVASFELTSEVRQYIVGHAYPNLMQAFAALDPQSMNTSVRPMKHQSEAIENWIANGKRGILKHATGSGKTITAILAIKEHSAAGLPSLVVVPSKLLLQQWQEELQKLIPEATILKAGDGNNSWRNRGQLAAMTNSREMTGNRIVLSTMQTASTTAFVASLSPDLSQLLLVADEVHNLGSNKHSQLLNIDVGFRLGLSATPQRFGDQVGTERLMDYFHGIVPPEFTLSDAIAAGRLTPYQYHSHIVSLTPEESEEWELLTREISREIARGGKDGSGNLILTERAKLLLIKRSRIAKKAKNKTRLAIKILDEHFQEGQRWLIYCEDQEQLNEVLAAIRERRQVAFEYHTGMTGDRSEHLHLFRNMSGILVSIRCLDEGVDLPEITHALILASSQNPRQFIQRRGRVLRASPGKTQAVVHDAIVVPSEFGDGDTQLSLLKAELARALEFSRSAINKSSGATLRTICIDNGINVDEMINVGVEEEPND